MKVLLAEFDLFGKIGGGQTVYRRLIEANPQIEFYYLGEYEAASAPRPDNAHLIPYQRPYDYGVAQWGRKTLEPQWAYRCFVDASNVAASVAGRDFDVVEMTDFRGFGPLLRPALAHHGVHFGRVALALHGRLSNSLRRDWEDAGVNEVALELREQLQYRAADTRYGISHAYLDQWHALVDRKACYLNPLRILEPPRPVLPARAPEPPDLHFVGRTEKCKGPDIFLNLVWWLPRRLYGSASIIGPESRSGQNGGSNDYLRGMMSHRLGDVALRPAMSPAELGRLFASRAAIVLPSRYDTLNLLALESLFAGCPTVVGSGAGVCRFLRDSLPEVPFVTVDIRNIYGSLPEIRALLADYDQYRERFVHALEHFQPKLDGLTLTQIYDSPPDPDHDLRAQLQGSYEQVAREYDAAARSISVRVKYAARNVAKAVVPPRIRPALRALRHGRLPSAQSLPAGLRWAIIRDGAFRGDLHLAFHAKRALQLASHYQRILPADEETEPAVVKKLQSLWSLAAANRVDQARMWSQIARLERMRNNEAIAAAYELRIMRAFGEDRLGHLPMTAASLRRHGHQREAETAEAMFGPPESRLAACEAILQRAWDEHKPPPPPGEFEKLDDRRQPGAYRVSVIVSLYKAADKLSLFLHALANQALARSGVLEVVLIDSGSPDREYEVFQKCQESLRLPVVYARSARRETIQAAWNRGIALARSPYLAFLGADETLVPDALEVLAAELDRDSGLDWVTGSSLMTRVDEHGTWQEDVMVYDRSDYHPTLPYLDTSYLSWVGALYRKSIHDRFGYYDSRFGAAGDTEFKNRMLPHLKTKAIPRILGVFLNYPEVRTTESPRAEIEDLRAWYLHRTLAGVGYAFDRRDPREALDLFYRCLHTHKSFWTHASTDLEYANQLANYLEQRAPGLLPQEHAASVRELLGAYRALDWLPQVTRWSPVRAMVRARLVVAQARLPSSLVKPVYRVFNDNRFEQHRNVWKSPVCC